MHCYVSGIGVIADGLPGWHESQALLARQNCTPDYVWADERQLSILPANIRRRTTPTIRLALRVAAEATTECGLDLSDIITVFASADGDGHVIDRICQDMQAADHPVSPTDFHNSVHNAPAAYWSLSTGSQAASVSIAAGQKSFAAGLLEAITQLQASAAPAVLLVCYDLPLPPPLDSEHTAQLPFAVALLLTRRQIPASKARLSITYAMNNALAESRCAAPLESVRRSNSAARALPLLVYLARESEAQVVLPYSSVAALHLGLEPC